jgi:hypothetical protein
MAFNFKISDRSCFTQIVVVCKAGGKLLRLGSVGVSCVKSGFVVFVEAVL